MKHIHAELVDALKEMHKGWVFVRRTHAYLIGVKWDKALSKSEEVLTKAGAQP